jgi:hypothetical protein
MTVDVFIRNKKRGASVASRLSKHLGVPSDMGDANVFCFCDLDIKDIPKYFLRRKCIEVRDAKSGYVLYPKEVIYA